VQQRKHVRPARGADTQTDNTESNHAAEHYLVAPSPTTTNGAQ
jgi:hypothetical protein